MSAEETPVEQGLNLTTSHGLRFPCPKAFSGKDEDWDLFQYKFRAYLSLANPVFKTIFTQASQSTSAIDLELELMEGIEVYAAQLQNALIALCEGPAAKIVQRQEHSENGLESWRLLCVRYAPSKRSKATGRMMKILMWKFDLKKLRKLFQRLGV